MHTTFGRTRRVGIVVAAVTAAISWAAEPAQASTASAAATSAVVVNSSFVAQLMPELNPSLAVAPLSDDDGNVNLEEAATTASEMWRFTRTANGDFTIANMRNGWCLTWMNYPTDISVLNFPCQDIANQLWQLPSDFATNTGWSIKSSVADAYLGMYGNNAAVGAGMVLAPWQGGGNQLFYGVYPIPLSVPTASLPTAVGGSRYTHSLTATGGAGPFTWSLVAGALPAGITLSSDGTISGTPTVVGAATVTVSATDSTTPQPNTATGQVSITVVPAPLVVTTFVLPRAVQGAAYEMALGSTGGTGADIWSLAPGSRLPDGLMLRGDGTVSGTPTATGFTFLTLQVTDSAEPPVTATVQTAIEVDATLSGQSARLVSGANFALTVGVYNSLTAAGASIVQSTSTGAANAWTLTPTGATYEIVNQNSHLCMTTDGIAGHGLVQMPCAGGDGQQWQVAPDFGGEGTISWIRNPSSNLYATVRNGRPTSGTVITAAPWTGASGQSFFPAAV
jgi:hypothetical protein